MITEGEAAILLETTQRAFRNQSQSKQRSTLGRFLMENTYLALPIIFRRVLFQSGISPETNRVE